MYVYHYRADRHWCFLTLSSCPGDLFCFKKKKKNYYSHFTVESWAISLQATYIYKINVKALLTSLRCSSTFMCKMAIMKLNMLSMFWVRVCWMSLRRWVGNVWKVITSSANLNRINITSSVWTSYERRKWILSQHDSLAFNFSEQKCADGEPHWHDDATWIWTLHWVQHIVQSFSNCMLVGKGNRPTTSCTT